jgi:hypothetical protein
MTLPNSGSDHNFAGFGPRVYWVGGFKTVVNAEIS